MYTSSISCILVAWFSLWSRRHSISRTAFLLSWLFAAFCVTRVSSTSIIGLELVLRTHRLSALLFSSFCFSRLNKRFHLSIAIKVNTVTINFSDYPLDAAMSRSYFEPIALARSESSNSPRHSFSSDRTLVETLQPQRPATSHTPNRPSHKRSAATLTTTENSTDTAVSIQGRRKKVKTFLKRMGVGMLESLAYVFLFSIHEFMINRGLDTLVVLAMTMVT